jgi:hypothetical protein
VQVVVEAIIFALNLVASTCVLNQSKGQWLLNALTIVITLTMNMEVELLQLYSLFEIFNPFEVEILFLHWNM